MDFELSYAQQEIKDRATEFADRETRYPAGVFEKLSGAGFVGPYLPEEYGGIDRDFLSYVLVIEEISRDDAGVGNTLACIRARTRYLYPRLGNEEQKASFAPDLARGRRSGVSTLPSALFVLPPVNEKGPRRGLPGYR